MKNSWLIWIFIVAVVITIFFAFNQQNNVPFNDIFPEDESGPVDVEYEFISKEHNKKILQQTNTVIKETAPGNVAIQDVPVAVESISSVKAQKVQKIEPAIEPQEVIATPPVKEIKKQEVVVETTRNFKYTVQIASFKKKSRADKLLTELIQKKYDAFIMSKDLKDAGTWYRVYAGKFDVKKKALSLLEKIKKEYKGSFVIAPK